MQKFKNTIDFLMRYKTFALWLIAFLLDQQYQILEVLLHIPSFWCTIIRGLGTVMLAYLTERKLKSTKQ